MLSVYLGRFSAAWSDILIALFHSNSLVIDGGYRFFKNKYIDETSFIVYCFILM